MVGVGGPAVEEALLPVIAGDAGVVVDGGAVGRCLGEDGLWQRARSWEGRACRGSGGGQWSVVSGRWSVVGGQQLGVVQLGVVGERQAGRRHWVAHKRPQTYLR